MLFVDVYESDERDEIYDDFERLGDFFVGCLKYVFFNDCFDVGVFIYNVYLIVLR